MSRTAAVLSVAVCAIASLGCDSKTQTAPDASPNVYAPSPAAPTPRAPGDPAQAIQRCLGLFGGEPVSTIVQECEVELTGDYLTPRVRAVDGPLAVILVSVGLTHDCRRANFIAWRPRDEWRLQEVAEGGRPLTEFNMVDPSTHFPWADALVADALVSAHRQAVVDGSVFLSLIYGANQCGSGPEMGAMLLSLEGDSWRVTWNGIRTAIGPLSHTQIEFVGDGIDQLVVSGDSWTLPDAKSHVFHESNPGPHRGFEQTWALRGDGYTMTQERVLPSAYNTLVEFVYRLSTGDDEGAASLATDRELVEQAKALGLVQSPPGQRWQTNWPTNLEPYTVCCGPIYILEGPPQQVLLTFVKREGDWFVASIEAANAFEWQALPVPLPSYTPDAP